MKFLFTCAILIVLVSAQQCGQFTANCESNRRDVYSFSGPTDGLPTKLKSTIEFYGDENCYAIPAFIFNSQVELSGCTAHPSLSGYFKCNQVNRTQTFIYNDPTSAQEFLLADCDGSITEDVEYNLSEANKCSIYMMMNLGELAEGMMPSVEFTDDTYFKIEGAELFVKDSMTVGRTSQNGCIAPTEAPTEAPTTSPTTAPTTAPTEAPKDMTLMWIIIGVVVIVVVIILIVVISIVCCKRKNNKQVGTTETKNTPLGGQVTI
ncbi:hypothetical protein WA158_000067 [Blastocystis sp. Blastoise]